MRIPGILSDVSERSAAAAALVLAPYWQQEEAKYGEQAPDYARHIVMLCGLEHIDRVSIRSRMNRVEFVELPSSYIEIDMRYQAYTTRIYETVLNILEEKASGNVLIQLVVSNREEQKLFAGLYGFLKTAHLENPRILGQVIEVEPDVTHEELAGRLNENSRCQEEVQVRYQAGKRWAASWSEVEASASESVVPWKDGGIYLITGGTGGLGLIFAEEIARRVREPVLILTGRSPLTKQKEDELSRLRGMGATVEYKQTDVTRREPVEDLIHSIRKKFGSLNGIIHSAGVVSDSFILKKTREEMHTVLAPKVSGLINLDLASRDLPLDFFVFFSSIAGSLGNPGQADYAAANAFMDAYAGYRNALAASGRRLGQTLSVGWPLWKEGGMHVNEETESLMLRSWGMSAMETDSGIRAFYQGLASGYDRVLVVSGSVSRIREKLLSAAAPVEPAARNRTRSAQVDPGYLKEQTVSRFKALFGEVAGMDASRIDMREPLESYGIDSIMINQLNRKMEDIFGELSKTLFYEYQTLGDLIGYLLEALPERCIEWTGLSEQAMKVKEWSDLAAPGSPVSSRAHDTGFPVLVSLREGKKRSSGINSREPEAGEKVREPIAIIGMSGRYPQANNLNEYWENLKSGKDCITEIPGERWSLDEFFHPDPEEAVSRGVSYSKWGSFLEGFAEFDPLFFNISPREAMLMDPQERLFIQSCWGALEDAGYTREQLAVKHNRRIGVFAGITKTGYELYGPVLREQGESANPYTSFSSVANRVSYVLNLNGPSMPVDTMCSSSLTAIHEACEHLHRNECEMAIAGGVNLYLHPSNYFVLCAQKMLSKDGRCKSFGKGADGFVPGEGVGAVLLKPLSRAVADEDPIYAVIRSTGINHGGKTNGYMVPNPAAQGELVRAALDKAGVHARTVSYMEAHGTGTDLGDPIEITGLTRAFAKDTDEAGFCAIGSAKSNIGHLEAAAGIAGLTKIVLQMKHQLLVPSLHALKLNPNINFAKTPFVVQQKLEHWRRPVIDLNGEIREYPRIAGVSSFGAGGSNAHVVLEEYTPPAANRPGIVISNDNPAIIPLSARNEDRLIEHAAQLLEAIRGGQWTDADLADIAYTFQTGREAMEERLVLVAGSMNELEEKLAGFVNGRIEQDGMYRGQAMPDKEAISALEPDQYSAAEQWTEHENYRKLLKLWIQGVNFDWNRIYKEVKPRRISGLPTYPFAKERYFIAKNDRKADMIRLIRTEAAKTGSEAGAIRAAGKGRRQEMKGLSLEQCLEWDLKEIIGNFMQIPRDKLNIDRNLADFGFDSISLSQLAGMFAKHFEIDFSPAVFFGHSSIGKVMQYFFKEHRAAVHEFYFEEEAKALVRAVPENRVLQKQALAAISGPRDLPEPVAIIGMSGRFPDARDIEEMWAILAEGRSAVREIPAERFDWRRYYSESGKMSGRTDSKWCGCIPGVAEFDPLFFEISPMEAETMDPRQRLLLQEAWKALEHAGYGTKKIKSGKIGMFVGAEQGDYQLLTGGEGSITSNHNAILAARLSYFLNLNGPVLAVDTACSSGLAAVHQACLSLRSDECDTAIAAGVNLMLTPEPYIGMSQAGMLSRDGKCFAFDQRANGLVPGEAVAVVVLKRLSRAEADGDPILAVIRGSGMNYDGKTNGITAPSGIAQTELLKSVYDQCKVDPADIEYVLTHGTGTKLGDPVEIHALQDAFKAYTDKQGYCAITSNKTNFGHTFASSGLVSLISLVQAFRYETIPASINFEQANDFIDWKESPFYVNTMNKIWPSRSDKSRTGAVSAFGMSGTNVHMVLESYAAEDKEDASDRPPYVLLALSAKTGEALEAKIRDMAAVLQNTDLSDQDMLNVSYTLLEGRQHFSHRSAIVARNREDALYALNRAIANKESLPNRFEGKVPRDFTGQSMIERYVRELQAEAQSMLGDKNHYRETLYALADLYCQGYDLDGTALYGGCMPRIVNLPAYPFAREHYWVTVKDAEADGKTVRKIKRRFGNGIMKSNAAAVSMESVRSSIRDGGTGEAYELMTFEEVWEEQALEEIAAGERKTAVCLISQSESKMTVLDAIKDLGGSAEVVFISQGIEYAKHTRHDYSIPDSDQSSYEQVLRSIKEDFKAIDAVLDLQAVEDSAHVMDYARIVRLIKAIGSAKLKPKHLLLAGRIENTLQRCYLDSWIGFERSLGLVLPGMQTAVVMVESREKSQEGLQSRERETDVKDALRQVWTELYARGGQSVLYQAGNRYVSRVKPISVETGDRLLKRGGTYLVTGGCGGLGLLFAEYLAGTYAANLILTGRSPMNEERQAKIHALESMGGQVLYVQADICDTDCMRAGLNQARERFGPIHGVIHAAGVSSGQTILDKETDDFQKVLAPKIEGTLALDDVTKEDPLDFICYFSSSSAVLGDFGACDYAVGNRFEAAYAYCRNERRPNLRPVVIQWPLWKDGGMGFNDAENTKMYLKSSGLRLLEAAEGLELFERILSSRTFAKHMVLAGQPSRVHRFLRLSDAGVSSYVPRTEEGDVSSSVPVAAEVNVSSIAAGKGWRTEMKGLNLEQCLERDLKEQVGIMLKIPRDKLDVEENLADFGFDSIRLAEFASLLSGHYGMEISPSLFFGHSTISKLIGYLANEHRELIKEFYRESSAEQPIARKPSVPPADSQTVRKAFRKSKAAAARADHEPIAIIGMSGRFPEARDTNEMWTVLAEGKSAVKEVPADRFDWRRYCLDGDDESGQINCRWCGSVPGVSEFDPMFFEISPKEAETMDPRQRLLLQEAWKALEDAGYGADHLKSGKIGMFVGVEDGDYNLLVKDKGTITSNHSAILAARLSYFLNLSGPNMAINTACSSGLVAVHQACMSLRSGESDTAVAAGVNLLLTPDAYAGISRAGILSADGKCYAFDQRANGTVPGEAVAVVVLKRLSQAEADGDPIHAVIRGSGVNYDGRTNGITAPNGVAQTNLLKEVYNQFDIHPDEIEYIVTHGTGTKLGDPVEINALSDAFKSYTNKQGYCALTSSKTNFGHSFAASGLVSLINLVLAMRHGFIPASLNCDQENGYIQWNGSPFYVNKEGKPWIAAGGKQRTGAVSAFGMSGTNAHMVLQSYSSKESGAISERPPSFLLALSAKTAEALEAKVRDMAGVFQKGDLSEEDLLPISYTLLKGRHHFSHRCAVVVRDCDDAQYVLNRIGKEKLPNLFEGRAARDFDGQRAIRQYAQELLEKSRKVQTDRSHYHETLCALADLYCQGYEMDWDKLFGDTKPYRVKLPAYPFAKEHYWVQAAEEHDDEQEYLWSEEPEWAAAEEEILPVHAETSVDIDSEDLAAAAADRLKKLLEQVAGIPGGRLEDEASFEELGLDSMMIASLNKKIEEWVGSLDATLFYKYNNVKSLAAYLAETYKEAAAAHAVNPASAPTVRSVKELAPVKRNAAAAFVRTAKSAHRPAAPFARNARPNADIAIIGVAGRYPKAETLDQFWNNLLQGTDCIEEIPQTRWPLEGFFEPDRTKAVRKGLSYSKWGGFLDRIEYFDPLFFNISPLEAMYMDPQERLFLEIAWGCMEDAGYTRESLKRDGYGNQIGVFAGATFNNYQLFMSEAAARAGQGVYMAPSQMFSIANRVSYIMNFTGPSLTVDTACSSSLYAVHLACESIRNGQSRMAIAGGVNLSLHPSKYITLAQGQFSASDGRCRAFSEGGTGYVPAEAVGAVFLKPLHEAVKDNDYIYGVIKGTAVSHAGRTNGYTVPSPVSQSLAIEQALLQSGVHPRTVSCIEAHGTGTSLGDPIEIKGLTDVFGKYTDETAFCSISSVKSNIGHAEAAAGIAQLTKVLLQLKHRTLVKNVMHGSGLNPNIDFARTPFVVQDKAEFWKRPEVNGRETPRRAGISSFGAGGANAHLIVEEYIPGRNERQQIAVSPQNPAMIVLSAKDEDRLREQAVRLLSVVRERKLSDDDLADMAFTLQAGREAMEERFAVIVGTIRELEDKLTDFVNGRDNSRNMFRGQVKRNKETMAVFEADEEIQEAMIKWIERKKYAKLLQLWVKGLNVDWSRLYGDARPGRISLPTYPFAGEPYWVPEMDAASSGTDIREASAVAGTAAIHPLLHRNTSDLSGVRFSSVFTGREFFLADHIVKGQRVLPGVAYLEMARTAAEEAGCTSGESRTGVRIKNVIWARPIAVGETPVQVHIDLFAGDNGEIAYEVYTEQRETGAEPDLHSQGTVVLCDLEPMPIWDMKALQAECSQGVISSDRIYETYKAMGIHYGPGHQGIEEVFVGKGRVLAKLSVPSAVSGTGDSFTLHPSLMDSALQATITLMMGADTDTASPLKPGLPFALEELEVFGRCPSDMWAVIRYSDGNKAGSKVRKLDIDLCDETGTVYVRMGGFSTRILDGEVSPSGAVEAPGILMLEPVWTERAVEPASESGGYAKHLVFLCEADPSLQGIVESRIDQARCICLESRQESIGERFITYAARVFEEIKNMIREKPKDKALIQVVVPPQDEGQLYSGLSGLLKAAQSENSKLLGQIIEIDMNSDEIAAKLHENSRCPSDHQIRFRDGKRFVAGWNEIAAPEEAVIPWKDKGIYLITGGAGGLGLIWAREIAAKVKEATLILTGRSPLAGDKETELNRLRALGLSVEYRQTDVTSKKQVFDLIDSIQENYGVLNGIIHGAGIIRDNLIVRKTVEELQEVMASKVTGLVNLDEASKDMPLDFLIAFSSVAGATGNPGQADYSAANAFMDAYAGYRNALTASKRRNGRMLSVNWPLWKEGGMRVDAEVEKMMLQSLGTVPMETSAGVEALYLGYASGKDQVVIMAGMLPRIRPRMLKAAISAPSQQPKAEAAASAPAAAAPASEQNDAGSLLDKVQTSLMQSVSRLLRVKLEDIDVHSELSEYGFDSISLTQLANMLNEEYKLDLTPTVFFEYTTLNSFAEYLVNEHRTAFAEEASPTLTGRDEPIVQLPQEPEDVKAEMPPSYKRPRSRPFNQAAPTVSPARDAACEPIAIVGMSGIFPMANDVNEFWSNIVEGKDCIVEIPKERWDWRDSLHNDAESPGKAGIKWGGFIEGVDEFDPLFFGISPREAEIMDPQQRLLLMQVWKAIEDAGIAPRALSKRPTGVFVAAGPGDYMNIVSISQGDPQAMTGVVPSLIPNRISYALDLHGPSEYCETACSSTLVALHRAIRSIHQGECEQALVGAVNLLLAPVGFVGFDSMGYLSPEGRAKSFQAGADGFVRSEGVGAVLIKPLSRAEADNDRIYAVIRGTGVSHGGSGMSLTSPNAGGMKAAMAQAFKSAGIDPRTVSYVEAHGIASPMADGIEVHALKSGYQEIAASCPPEVQSESPHYIGSLKPGIGHGEVASGMAALIKSVQAIRHRLIPGIQGFTAPNEHISLEGSRFRMTAEHVDWEALTDAEGRKLPRRASINSYGIGGVNAHVVLEEYISPQQNDHAGAGSASKPQLVVLSAKNPKRLEAYARQILEFAENEPEFSLADFAYTLQVGRDPMESRLAFAAGSKDELIYGLKEFLAAFGEEPVSGEEMAANASMSIFVGDTRNSGHGKADDNRVRELLALNNLEELALYWTKGGEIPWETVHAEKNVRRLSLPAYPFEQRRCWPAPKSEVSNEQARRPGKVVGTLAVTASPAANSLVTDIISRILGMSADEINPDTPLHQYGLDSILLMQLLQQLQNQADPEFGLAELQECKTLQDIIHKIRPQMEDKPVPLEAQAGPLLSVLRQQFPELILLNKGTVGSPVFWFHGGLGGVEMYQTLAQKSRRPFYGIQARGWLTDRSPLQGVGAMAAYYAHIIQSVQPDGPYDLGGYSLGGVLAYEVLRQLQELGKPVNTVVMLDSPYGIEFQQGEISRQSAVLQAVNLALASQHFQEPEKFAKTLIHRDEVDLNTGEVQLLKRLITLGSERGLTKTENQIHSMIEANIKIQHAYQFDRFSIMPLPDADAVTCYYFRNKGGLIFGELEPYFSTTEDSSALDRAKYWEEWERQFSNLHMFDIDVSNHMVLLSEPKAYETIYEFCEELYSGKRMESKFLQAFKRKTKKLHGSKIIV